MTLRFLSKRVVIVVLYIGLSFFSVTAQETKQTQLAKLDSILTQKYQGNSPGAAVVLVQHGDIVFNKAYGAANLEHRVVFSDSTVFDIASVSKHFTGYAISVLVEQGLLSLEDEVHKYIPEFPDFGSPITIDHLLHHTSGLRDWTAALRLSGLRKDDVITYDHILRMAFNQRDLNFPTGSEYSYTNTGYNLLVEIIQRVTNQSFQKWTAENIFGPLGMTQTFFADSYTKVVGNIVQGYEMDAKGQFQKTPNNLVAPGSSSLYTTPTDFAKWMIHMDKAEGIYKSIFDRMYQRGKLNDGSEISYALGLDMASYGDAKWIDHSGGWASLRTYFTYFPEHHLSIVVMKNNGRDARDIAYDLTDLFLMGTLGTRTSEDHSMIQKPLTIWLPREKLEKYAGIYQVGNANYLNISLDKDVLNIKYNNEDNSRIHPVKDSIFWVEQDGLVLSFRNDGREVIYHNTQGEKIAEPHYCSPNELKEYCGTFYSEELKTHYEVMVLENQLVLHHFNHGNIKLERIWQDSYGGERWFTKTVNFYRNQKGEVIGLKVSHDRARNQDFEKKNRLKKSLFKVD